MEGAAKTVPESMIYEMVDGQPIYYRGYKEILKGKVNQEEPVGSSFLQSLIISNLVILLHKYLGNTHVVLTNEIGIQFSKGNWRAADIAVFESGQLDITKATNKYLSIPPKIVIEIDTKAEMNEIKDTFKYYNEKTDQLLPLKGSFICNSLNNSFLFLIISLNYLLLSSHLSCRGQWKFYKILHL